MYRIMYVSYYHIANSLLPPALNNKNVFTACSQRVEGSATSLPVP